MTQSWLRGLRGRLLLAALLPLVGFAVVAGFAFRGIDEMGGIVDLSFKDIAPTLQAMGEMETSVNAIARHSWVAYVTNDDKKSREQSLENARLAVERFESARKAYVNLPMDAKEKELYQPIAELWPKASEKITVLFELLKSNTPEADAKAKDFLVHEYRPISRPLEKSIIEISAYYQEYIQAETLHAKEATLHTLRIVFGASVIASLLTLILMLMNAARLSGSMGQIAIRLADSANNVSSSSQQLSAAGHELSSSSTEAAAALAETVSSLEELSSMVKLNADNAKEAAALSQSSKEGAEQGEQEIRTLIESMTEISQSSKKIEEIINVIDDIAFQTNLLALNAAVEAARAGDQGKGFAVVAEAVRGLAQRSSVAAKDINVLIKESVSKIERGTKVADQSGSVLKNILISVKKVADLNAEISSASQEQSTGIAQISQAMNQLDQATQTNASSATEVASSSEAMSSQSIGLQNMVSELNVMVNGADKLATAQPVRAHATVTPIRSKLVRAHSREEAEHILPLDDERSGKVGTTDGF